MRLLTFVLALYLVSVVGPFAAVLNFVAQGDRIARELCVQRSVPEAQRTCHGQCHLRKQLKEAGDPTNDKGPLAPSFRYEEQCLERSTLRVDVLAPPASSRALPPEPACAPLPGHVPRQEGVPRVG